MKNLLRIGFLGLLVSFMMTSCEDDFGTGTGGGTGGGGSLVNDPSILLSSETGFVSFEATVAPGETFQVRLIGEKGDDDLQAITVREDGNNIDAARLSIDGSPAAANPFTLFNDDLLAFSKDLTITAHSTPGTSIYSFELRDIAGKTVSESVSITVDAVPPTISIGGTGMFMADLGTLVSVPLMVTNVTTPLDQIAVYADGNLVDAMQLWYDDLSIQFPSNPAFVPDSDEFGINRTIFIRAANPGTTSYRIEVTDDNGNAVETSFTIDAGTVATTLSGVLFNRSGPAGQGGLDLSSGDSVGSNDASADIKDEGIDLNAPVDDNWIKKISGANGTIVKHLFPNQNGLAESFSFESIDTKEQIAAVYNNGIDFSLMNSSGEFTSLTIEIGDMFVALRDNEYYMFVVRDIVETANDNLDNYVLDIKF